MSSWPFPNPVLFGRLHCSPQVGNLQITAGNDDCGAAIERATPPLWRALWTIVNRNDNRPRASIGTTGHARGPTDVFGSPTGQLSVDFDSILAVHWPYSKKVATQ